MLVLSLNPRSLSAYETGEIRGRYHSKEALPSLAKLGKISRVNPQSGIDPDLMITAAYFAYSESRLYAGIQTAGGGFPLSAALGTRRHGYFAVIANPDNEEIVWAMVYIDAAVAGLSPGLYRVLGTGRKDLIRIGDIEYRLDEEDNLLVMSADLADLMADPGFTEWYRPEDPQLSFVGSITSTRILPYRTDTISSSYPGGILRLAR
jgi:hypothetical protein